MSKLVTQVDLEAIGKREDGPQPKRKMTTWLEHSKHGLELITVGRNIQLKDVEDTWWKIVKVYDTRKASDIDKHGWDNNNYDKHEGLFKRAK